MAEPPIDGYWVVILEPDMWIRCDDNARQIIESALFARRVEPSPYDYVWIYDLYGSRTMIVLSKIVEMFTDTMEIQASCRRQQRKQLERLDELDPEGAVEKSDEWGDK